VHEVSAVTTACLLIRREVFDAVNGLDEDLIVAFNDVDLCLRVRAAGYRTLWTPFAELIHHESISRGRDLTPAEAKRFAGEFATMQRRWGADLLHDPYYSPHLTHDMEDFSLRLRYVLDGMTQCALTPPSATLLRPPFVSEARVVSVPRGLADKRVNTVVEFAIGTARHPRSQRSRETGASGGGQNRA
jgi:hypothetical protein